MESLNKNGVSITQTPGEEKYLQCYLEAFRGQIYYQLIIATQTVICFLHWLKHLKYAIKSGTSGQNAKSNDPFTSYFRQTYTRPNRAGFVSGSTPVKKKPLKRQ